MENEDKPKYGAETDVVLDGDVKESERVEIHNGGNVRRLKIREESVRYDDKKRVLETVMDGLGKWVRGEVVGFTVDASKYDPKTLKADRMVVTTIKLMPKTA